MLYEDMKDLLQSYKETLETVTKAKNKASKADAIILSSIETSLKYSIAWMGTGFEPLPTDISKYSYSQREIPVDPALLTKYRVIQYEGGKEVSKKNQAILNDLLCSLTPHEKDAIILVRGSGFSFQEAANMMGYKSKGSVERLVTAAEEKIRKSASKQPGEDIYLLKAVQIVMAL